MAKKKGKYDDSAVDYQWILGVAYCVKVFQKAKGMA
jgi:hypothetical protein